jgi:hypothetical protein
MVPIWINNRNRLTTTRNMVEYLHGVAGAIPIIVDNASTYPPLLEWYRSYLGQVVLLQHNVGAFAPWRIGIDLSMGWGYYVVTDSDLDISRIPLDLLEKLQSGLDTYPHIVKAGLSLEVNDLPPWEAIGLSENSNWESPYWQRKTPDGWWIADTDTTFAMYRGNWHSETQVVTPALRSDRPYTARHIPWYRIMDEEELYYESHADLAWATTAKAWSKVKRG